MTIIDVAVGVIVVAIIITTAIVVIVMMHFGWNPITGFIIIILIISETHFLLLFVSVNLAC